MFTIGCHLSISKGYAAAAKEAVSIGANSFQFFTRNPRGGAMKAYDAEDMAKCRRILEENNFGRLLAHAPYTYNLASDKPEVRSFALQAFAEDLERMENSPCDLYNFHPGSHVGQGDEQGIAYIVDGLNSVLRPDQKTFVLLEGMAGKGSEIGYTFEQLAEIISKVTHKHVMGVCLDTCHLYSAGYDIVGNLDGVIDDFDRIVGLERLKAIHLNDSMVPYQSRKDRHETIGNGSIGQIAIEAIINHPKLKDLPFLLETPNEVEGYAQEIQLLKGLRRP